MQGQGAERSELRKTGPFDALSQHEISDSALVLPFFDFLRRWRYLLAVVWHH